MADRSTAVPVADRAWVGECADGVIAVSPGPAGDVGCALLHGRAGEAEHRAGTWASVFADRFYLGVQRTGRAEDAPCLESTVDLAMSMGLPVVAGNDVRFLERDDFEAHEARVCIHDGRILADPRRPRRYSEEQYLKSPQEMAALFEDLPEALENAVEIARRCTVTVELGGSHLPEFPVPDGHDLDEWFAERTRAGLRRRLERTGQGAEAPGGEEAQYRQRLERELDIICRMGYPGYFLIVADFIRWAREQRIPVGPGRGSGAGIARRLRAGNHRSRPAPVRPAVRAFPEPGAGVAAGFRHRLLHGGVVIGSSTTSPPGIPPTTSPRSSPSGRWRPRRWCATSAGCSVIPTASSTRSPSSFRSSSG